MQLRRVTIENFRGFKKIEVDLDETTVLIGENNSGKTSFLDALRLCMDRLYSRRANPFDDYDYHLDSKIAQPRDAKDLVVILDFCEDVPSEWDTEIEAIIADFVTLDTDGKKHVIYKVISKFDTAINDFLTTREFLNTTGSTLRRVGDIYTFQKLVPVFYLSALRDAAREFQSRANYWSPFLRNPNIPIETQKELENALSELNQKILESNTSLKEVKAKLDKTQGVVSLERDGVSIEALPGRIWDLLSRAQVNVAGMTGANLPLIRHGIGTQSLSVLFLFEAYLDSMLKKDYDEYSEPLLAIEEPEAHLHPSAIRTLWTSLIALKGQKIIATHSGDLLAQVPLTSIRRFRRVNGEIEVRRVQIGTLDDRDYRKLQFHVRNTRGELFFAKCWLLVEGETDYWVVTEIANILGIDLERLGIRVVTYTNIGLNTLVKVADDLGIEWFGIADGDSAGQGYYTSFKHRLNGKIESEHITILPNDNMEELLCTTDNDFGDVYLNSVPANKKSSIPATTDPTYWKQVVGLCHKTAKIDNAFEVLQVMNKKGEGSVPSVLRAAIEGAKALAERC